MSVYKKIIGKPCVISITADINQGKSMLLYDMIETLLKSNTYKLYYYGLRLDVKNKYVETKRIYSVAEMEAIRDSLIVIDELSSLFDLDNRKTKKHIENTLRLLNHNNNILILCGVPENFKKFLSAKVNIFIYKKVTLSDFINGSRIKHILTSYKGYELGSEILNLKINEALIFDGQHYEVFNVNYYPQYDSKKENSQIIRPHPKLLN